MRNSNSVLPPYCVHFKGVTGILPIYRAEYRIIHEGLVVTNPLRTKTMKRYEEYNIFLKLHSTHICEFLTRISIFRVLD